MKQYTPIIETLFDYQAQLGEGPIWEEHHCRLRWVDIGAGTVHFFDTTNNEHQQYKFPVRITALAKRKDGRYIAVSDCGFVALDFCNQDIQFITDPERGKPNNRFNDGKLDGQGRFWAGTMDEVYGARAAGKLYMLDNDGTLMIKINSVTCSNGLAWSHNWETFYFIDSLTYSVVAYDFDASTGAISNPRVVIEFPIASGLPDGMTIDRDGMLWIALWGGGKVICCDPLLGEVIRHIDVPASHVTSCTFGGLRNETLFVTTARDGLTEAELLNQPLAGSIFKVTNIF